MTIPFFKYHGTGNDFILIDSREHSPDLSSEQIARLCHRRFGIGADGLMELKLHPDFDFEMVYYNSDGRPGSMCGNGGRCITRFAQDLGIPGSSYRFLASDGPHESGQTANGWIRLHMKDVDQVTAGPDFTLLDTGSPHYVKTVDDLRSLDVVNLGRSIRYSDAFKEKGVNVNFVERQGDGSLFVRTYERGVEDETYSCGTGVTAAALAHAQHATGYNHMDIETLGGRLHVEFNRTDDQRFESIWLAGPAQFVFSGHAAL